MSIRVVLADDHRIMREGLRALLEKETDMDIVGEADTGRSAVDLGGTLEPDVIVMDMTMPDLNGIEATRQVVAVNPAIKVLALSMHSDKRFVAGALGAGASGYLLKDCAVAELVRAIRIVVVGKTYLSPSIASMVVQGYTRRLQDTDRSLLYALTPREREVLQLIAEGRSVKEIAHTLHLSVKTIETHRQQTMNKLAIRTVADLTKFAIREGLTSLEQ